MPRGWICPLNVPSLGQQRARGQLLSTPSHSQPQKRGDCPLPITLTPACTASEVTRGPNKPYLQGSVPPSHSFVPILQAQMGVTETPPCTPTLPMARSLHRQGAQVQTGTRPISAWVQREDLRAQHRDDARTSPSAPSPCTPWQNPRVLQSCRAGAEIPREELVLPVAVLPNLPVGFLCDLETQRVAAEPPRPPPAPGFGSEVQPRAPSFAPCQGSACKKKKVNPLPQASS